MMESLRGQFLIAGKSLRDPNFHKSVVLMVEHGSEGAMGLIVNRPSTVSISDALSEHFQLPEIEDLVYIGGPVEPSALFIVHNRDDLDHADPPIVPGVYVGSSPEAFETVVRSAIDQESPLQFRIFCGCAGWSGGQLEGEIARGDWFTLPATAEIIFNENPYDIWDMVRTQLHRFPSIPRENHENPEWN
ncbi:MAG: YqgE/AlgH family protein [Planctomycetaceae bacterium]